MYIIYMSAEDIPVTYESVKFELHCLKHIDALRKLALYLSFDPNEAEDLLQDTLLRAYRFFHRFNIKTNCRAWLFRIMKNLFINNYKKKQKHKNIISLDNYNNNTDKSLFCNVEQRNPEFAVVNNMIFSEIIVALDLLPTNYRKVVLLADMHSYSYAEIAKVLDCPIGTVRSRLSRGRKLLKKHLNRIVLEDGLTS